MAVNWEILKTRYLQSSRIAQLESLTLNLARIQSLTENGEAQVAYHLVRESQFFIEWTVPTIDLEIDLAVATTLVDLQRLLSSWKLNWSTLWQDSMARQRMAAEAQVWLDRLQDQSIRLAG